MPDATDQPQTINVKCPRCKTLVRARRPFGGGDKAMTARIIERIKEAYAKGHADGLAEQAKREGT